MQRLLSFQLTASMVALLPYRDAKLWYHGCSPRTAQQPSVDTNTFGATAASVVYVLPDVRSLFLPYITTSNPRSVSDTSFSKVCLEQQEASSRPCRWRSITSSSSSLGAHPALYMISSMASRASPGELLSLESRSSSSSHWATP